VEFPPESGRRVVGMRTVTDMPKPYLLGQEYPN
jgi:hypothetical protein